MLKGLGLLFLSIFVTPVAVGNMASFERTSKVVADPEPEYTYTEEVFNDGEYIVRTYDTQDLLPSIDRHFCAPSGYAFTLSITDEQINKLLDLSETVGNDYSLVDPIYYYKLLDSEIYSNSNPLLSPETREKTFDGLKDSINGAVLFKTGEITVTNYLEFTFKLQFSTSSDKTYEFVFRSDVITIEPVNELDFLTVRQFYYESTGSDTRRVSVDAHPVDGFFYECYSYNQFGFHTDTTTPVSEGSSHFYADYTIQLIANDEIILAETNGPNAVGVEMKYPEVPLTVKAKVVFYSGGEKYTFYSRTYDVMDPNACVTIDGYIKRESVQRGVEHDFSFNVDGFDLTNGGTFNGGAIIYPYRLSDPDYGHELFNQELPQVGQEEHYYYIPSDEELADYNAGGTGHISDEAQGQYKIWNPQTSSYDDFVYIDLLEINYPENPDDEPLTQLPSVKKSLPFIGKWQFSFNFIADSNGKMYGIESNDQFLDVVASAETEDYLVLDVPDQVNLILGGNDIEITPSVPTRSGFVEFYYEWECSKEGIINISSKENGVLTVNPHAAGLVDLTVTVESRYFASITKTISVRVMEMDYDSAKIEVPNEFHYTGKELTAKVNLRGITSFLNLDVSWEITNKKGEVIPEDQYRVNRDASVTLLSPENMDYTFKVSYEGIELDSLTLSVRDIDINKFLRANIWWIVLITLSMVALIIFFKTILRRGRTTVERIERVYQVFCACMHDDKLSVSELKTIKREITRCLHHVEDMNIDALNQYEKATRYLRKSLADTKALLNEYDHLTPEEKSVITDRLDKDLAKALNVAKEIENAKDLIEAYHATANKKNYETLKDDKPSKKK